MHNLATTLVRFSTLLFYPTVNVFMNPTVINKGKQNIEITG